MGQPGANEGRAADSGGAVEHAAHAVPERLKDLDFRSWRAVLRRTGKEFVADQLPDRAAALTYYGVLAIFPALLVMVSLLAVAGPAATQHILGNLQQLAPGSARTVLHSAVVQLQADRRTGGVLAVVGLLTALWSSSRYVAGFTRAANAVYDIREGRPVWKTLPLRLGLTVLMMLLLAGSVLIVVFTGPLADLVGRSIGVGSTGLTVWAIAKWPVLVALVAIMITALYWAAPNVRAPRLRWLSPGSLLAVAVWLLASGGFALYVANFGSYNKTYGALAGVVVFLVWLWLSNLAILLGLEFDAELARERALESGLPADEEPYVEPRDTRTWPRRLRLRKRWTSPS